MIIDTHQHVFWQHKDDAGLIRDMDESHIDVAWLLSWEIPPAEDHAGYHPVLNPAHSRPDGTHPGIPLADGILARDRYPRRFILGYAPPPVLGNAPDLFQAAYEIHGVRVCGEWKFRILVDDPRCIELFRKAGELKCPVVVHLDVPYLLDEKIHVRKYQPLWYGGTIENLERAMRACSQTHFIGHAPGFWREVSGDADNDPAMYPKGTIAPGGKLDGLFERNPNLHADLSAGSGLGALKRDPKWARQFITRWADRLLFARDFYGRELADFLATLELPGDVSERIHYANAAKLVPLDNLSTRPAFSR